VVLSARLDNIWHRNRTTSIGRQTRLISLRLCVHEIQAQEKIALDKGDINLFRQLLDQQTEAWKIVYVQATRLIASGRAPSDMIERLEKILNIHRDHEQRIRQADAAIQRKLGQLRPYSNSFPCIS